MRRLFFALFIIFLPAVAWASGQTTVYFFHGETCPHCQAAMPFIQSLEQKYPGLMVEYKEVYNSSENLALFRSMAEAYGTTAQGVPTFFIGNFKPIVGFVDQATSGPQIEDLIAECVEKSCPNPITKIKSTASQTAGSAASQTNKNQPVIKINYDVPVIDQSQPILEYNNLGQANKEVIINHESGQKTDVEALRGSAGLETMATTTRTKADYNNWGLNNGYLEVVESDQGNQALVRVKDQLYQYYFSPTTTKPIELKTTLKILGLDADSISVQGQDGQTLVLKVKPEVLKEKLMEVYGQGAIENLNLAIESGQPQYQLLLKEKVKLFGLIPVLAQTKLIVAADAAQVLKIKKPWWSILATGFKKFNF